MRGRLVFLAALVLVAARGGAWTVFITSSPPGATVGFNGVELAGRTPLIHEDEGALAAQFTVSLPGYETSRVTAGLDPDEATVIEVRLEPDFVLTGFPEEPSVFRLQGEYPPARFVRLPQGHYTVEREGGSVVLTPRYPRDTLIGGVSIGAAVALGTMVASFASGGDADPESRISAGTLVSGAAAIALVVADIVLLADRGRYLASFEPVVLDSDPIAAQLLLDRADIALETGSLAVALEALDAYVTRNPDGPRVAESLYRQARILVSLARYDEAIERYDALITTYPDPRYYDRSLLGISEALGRTGRPRQGIDALERVTFVGASPTREEIDLRRAELYDSLAATDPGVIDDRADAWLRLAAAYPDATDIDFYRLMAADALLDAERTDEAEAVFSRATDRDATLEPLYAAVAERLRDYE